MFEICEQPESCILDNAQNTQLTLTSYSYTELSTQNYYFITYWFVVFNNICYDFLWYHNLRTRQYYFVIIIFCGGAS